MTRRRALPAGWTLAVLAVLTVLVAGTGACGRPAAERSPALPADPRAADLEGLPVAARWRQLFDGSPAGIQLGSGWYEPDADWQDGPHQGGGWSNQVSKLYFGVPGPGDFELKATVVPYLFKGSRPQSVKATLNEQPLGTFTLVDDWAPLQIPLPARALTSPVNSLILAFDHAVVPAEIGAGGDVRRLAALFDSLEVVPRGAGEPAPPAKALAPRRPGGSNRAGRSDRAGRADQPDIFIYLIDTLRRDALGVYGAPIPVSPRIDAFSREAVVYDRAASPSSWTLPATFSILSGLYPFHHGVLVPGDRLAPERRPWLPDLMARAGYDTVGITQWMLGGDAFGLQRGFARFYMNLYQTGKARPAGARWLLAQELMRPPHPEKPFFCFLHTVDPHALYQPRGEDRCFADERPGTLPESAYSPNAFIAQGLGGNPADVRHLRALYDGEVRAADREFGAFLDLLRKLGLYDESLIVLVADHGEEFHEHGGFDHGRTLYEELLRVPLLVKLPRSRGVAPGRVGELVSSLDLAPTLLAAAGRAVEPAAAAGFDGRTLPGLALPAASPGSGEERRLYAETRAAAGEGTAAVDLLAVREGGLQCIIDRAGGDRTGPTGLAAASKVGVFDLDRDPGQIAPLPPASPQGRRCAELFARLAAKIAAEAPARTHVPLPTEDAARLKALGYLH